MPHENTIKALREILAEMFSEERANALPADAKPWHEHIGAKTLDCIDFKYFVQDKFAVQPHAFFFDNTSLADIAEYIETATPNTNPH